MKNKPSKFDILEYTAFNIQKSSLNLLLFLSLFMLVLILVVFSHFHLDIYLQNFFYEGNGKWIIDSSNFNLKLLFYIIPKKIITIFLVGLLILAIKNFIKKNKMIALTYLYVVLAAITSLLMVGVLKQTTNMYCPDRIIYYGGSHPYITIIDNIFVKKESLEKPGKCYPAGHASAGFCLFGLAFVLKKRRNKILAFTFVSLLGFVLGGYQVFKGVHYVSDTLVSFILSLTSANLIYNMFLQFLKGVKK